MSRLKGSRSCPRRHTTGALFWQVRTSAIEQLAVAILKGEVDRPETWADFAAWAQVVRTPARREDPYVECAEVELDGGVPCFRDVLDDVCLRPHVRNRAGVGLPPGTPPVEDPYGFGDDSKEVA